jgi:hypothetical protein
MDVYDDEDSPNDTNQTPWQLVRGVKRRKPNLTPPLIQQQHTITTSNRYKNLPNMDMNDEVSVTPTTPAKFPRPPPIYVYDVINYPTMIKHIAEVAEEETYSTKSMANNIIKINCNSPDTYRKLISFMKDRNIITLTNLKNNGLIEL